MIEGFNRCNNKLHKGFNCKTDDGQWPKRITDEKNVLSRLFVIFKRGL